MRLTNASTTVVKNGNLYEVNLEGDTVGCSVKLVNYIVNETGEKLESIATIVARIKSLGDIRSNRESFVRKMYFRTEDIKRNLPCIIEAYGIEDTLEIIEGLKGYEVKEILASSDPLETIQEFI